MAGALLDVLDVLAMLAMLVMSLCCVFGQTAVVRQTALALLYLISEENGDLTW